MEAELIRLLTSMGGGGLGFIMAFLGYRLFERFLSREVKRDEIEAKKDERQDDQVTALTNAINNLTGVFGAMTVTMQAMQTHTGAIPELATRVDGVAGRLEAATNVMAAVTRQRNKAQAALQQSIDNLPAAVRLALVADFESVGTRLALVSGKVTELHDDVRSALDEWTSWGVKLRHAMQDPDGAEHSAPSVQESPQETGQESAEAGEEPTHE